MAKGKRIRARNGILEQSSPFLRLPGEIRTHIYRDALLKAGAIDLWPYAPIDEVEKYPDLVRRLNKDHTNWKFRDQHDLRYVRQELAIGLLGTCKQIRMEAANIFWQDNLFRFSTDIEWTGLRRFLTTIGADARSSIKHLEVAPPNFTCTLKRIGDSGDPWRRPKVKNHPKLHMAKLYSSGETDNFRFVSHLLHEKQTLEALRLVVPENWGLVYPERVKFDEQWDPLRFLDLSLVVERGGQLSGKHDVEVFISQGIPVTALVGSLTAPQFPLSNWNAQTLAPVETMQLRKWLPPSEAADEFISGMDMIFDESECIDAARRGKRVGKKQASMSRVLKGFGGCRFVSRSGAYCANCNQAIVYGKTYNETYKKYGSFCVGCKAKAGIRFAFGIEVRKLTREARKNRDAEDEEADDS